MLWLAEDVIKVSHPTVLFGAEAQGHGNPRKGWVVFRDWPTLLSLMYIFTRASASAKIRVGPLPGERVEAAFSLAARQTRIEHRRHQYKR
jgi:hypothetical protein